MSESQVFNNGKDNNSYSDYSSRVGFFGRVFLYLFLGLLLSAGVCLLLSNLLYRVLSSGSSEVMVSQFGVYMTILIVSGVALIITSIVISFKQMRSKNILIPYIIYSLLMGITLSGLVVFIGDPNIIGSALGVTSLLFLVMCICGFLFKGRIGWIVGMLVGLCVTGGILCLVNIFLFPFAFGVESAFDAYCTIYWISEGVFLLIILISTFLDMWRINQISKQGAGSSNIELYCALNLYSDFIMIFVRVLYFIAISGILKRD